MTTIIAPGGPGRDVMTLMRDEVVKEARRHFQPTTDARVAPRVTQ